MRSYSMTPKLILGFMVFLLVTTVGSISYAQDQPAQEPQFWRVSEIQLNPGMSLEFEAFLGTVIPSMKKSGVQELYVWKTDKLGEGDVYTLLGPLKSLAELDAPGLMEGSTPPAVVATFLSAVQRMVAGTQTFIIRMRPDLGVAPKEGYDTKFGIMQTLIVAPGRNDEFEKRSKELSAVVAKAGIKGVLASKIAIGGNTNQYGALILYDSFADMEKTGPALRKALTEANLSPQPGVVLHVENAAMRRIPELCIVPEAQ